VYSQKGLCLADLDGDGKLEYVLYDSHKLRAFKTLFDGKSFELGDSWEIKDTDGKAVHALCPYPVDFDGDGVIAIVGVVQDKDGKNPRMVIYRGVNKSKGRTVRPAIPVIDETGKPIPAGSDLCVLDWDGDGILDLLILDYSGIIRWHRGKAKGKPIFSREGLPIHANAFCRMDEFYAPCLFEGKTGRSDLMLRANLDQCCGKAFEATRVYRNTLGSGPCAFAPGAFITAGTQPLPWGALAMEDPFACDFDGDGKIDILFWRRSGNQVEVYLMRGEEKDSPLTNFKKAPELLLTAPWTDLRPFAADWNGDGRIDLLIGANTAAGPRVFLLLNQGTNVVPKFGEPVPLTVDGKPVGYGNTICIADWDRDGRPDLVAMVTGAAGIAERLVWHRNLDGSASISTPVEIRRNVLKGNMIKLSAGDLDGDGVTDLVVGMKYFDGYNCVCEGQLWFYRGLTESTPSAVHDLRAEKATETSIVLAWSPPAGAARAEVRYSRWPIDEATWFRATPVKEPLSVAGSATVKGLERGKVYHFAVCCFGPGGERSTISNCPAVATRPLQLAILAKGFPAPELGVANYAGSVGVIVQAHATQEPSSIFGQGLRAQQGIHSYLKFDLSPLKGKTIRKATLTLVCVTGRVEAAQMLYCREILSPWEPKRVRYSTRDGAARWTPSDYGEALVCPGCEPMLGRREWDATRTVQRAVKNENALLSLQLVSDSSTANLFGDPDAKQPAVRPRLTVVFEHS
jgi:hypothetical protein